MTYRMTYRIKHNTPKRPNLILSTVKDHRVRVIGRCTNRHFGSRKVFGSEVYVHLSTTLTPPSGMEKPKHFFEVP